MDELETKLSRLSPRAQMAFAAINAERALKEGDPYSKHEPAADPLFRQALDIAWRYASGDNIDYDREVAAIHDEVVSAIPDRDEPGADEILNYVASAVARALMALAEPEDSAFAAASAGSRMVGLVTHLYADREKAEAEEEAWQLRAIEFLKSLGTQPPSRPLLTTLPEYPRGKIDPYFEERRRSGPGQPRA